MIEYLGTLDACSPARVHETQVWFFHTSLCVLLHMHKLNTDTPSKNTDSEGNLF